MKAKKWLACGLAALLCLFSLSGCESGGGSEASSGSEEEVYVARNDGGAHKVVLGELFQDEARTAVLREIADKYRADFPNTEIEIRSFDSADELKAALEAGEVEIAEVRSDDQTDLVKRGLLMNLDPYLDGWDEYATLTSAAKSVVYSLGSNAHAYLLPNDLTQELLFFRADWFNEYNADKGDKEKIFCLTWDQLLKASAALGEKGKLSFAGRDKLLSTFDAFVWSAVSMNGVSHPSCAYFHGEDETVFTLESAAKGAAQFFQVMEEAALPDAADWTKEEAVDAFVRGDAAFLLADRSVTETLNGSMPEGSWRALGLPRGLAGVSAFSLSSFAGWGVSAASEEGGTWETAFHFLTFLSNADNNTHYARETDSLPIHAEAKDMELSLTEGDLAAELGLLQHSGWYGYASEPVMYKAWAAYPGEADGKLRAALDGTLAQDELLNWLDGYWLAALKDEGPAAVAAYDK